MLRYLPVLLCLSAVGCANFEINSVKIDERSNGKQVVVPKGKRLIIVMQGPWYKDVQDMEASDTIKLVGVEHQEQLVNGRFTQFVAISFAVHGDGDLRFRYETRRYSVKVYQK